MPDLRRAVIPAAGRGTRLHPFTLAVPKELAPLGSKPAIHFVLDEAARAELEEAIVVVAPGKELLRRYLDLAKESGAWPDLRLRYTTQEQPTGLADAIARCEPLLEGEPFAVLLPDNLPLAPDYRLGSMVDLWRRRGQNVVGVIEIDRRWSGLFGNSGRIDSRPLEPGVVAVDRLHDKAPGRFVVEGTAQAPLLRACGRYVFGAEILALLAESRRTAAGELDEVPAVQRLAREHGLLGALLPMPLFDVGHPNGLLAASAYLAAREGLAPTVETS
ncbi:MAG TPA: sugar phosphate nucleotidyltransferase [Thermoanaerobaculia bacterium]|nr:sugar phosphate nucleotidyltransferase [Thermoanaerobaculia bacterium]